MYDAIVVGAGPSGASAAYELARNGARVLILERQKLPRYKACGGVIPDNFFKTLPPRVQSAREAYFEKVAYYGGASSHSPMGICKFAGVMRARFDYEFTLAAVDQSAELLEGIRVLSVEETRDYARVKTSSGSFEARYLIGADGATGVVKRQLKIGGRALACAAIEAEIKSACDVDASLAKIHTTIVRDGYAWVFPKNGIDSIGIASFGRDRKNVRQRLEKWAVQCGYSMKGEQIHGHPIPVWNGPAVYNTPRCLLVGDAADTVDPFIGEGIRYGIQSGRIAAGFIARALESGESLKGYTQTLYREIHADFVYARRIACFFYRFPEFCYEKIFNRLGASDKIGKVFYGEMSYRDAWFTTLRFLASPKQWGSLAKRLLKK